ncbi:hypothetical protein F4818DRAFT_443752 [Hypoxylon cercidicola]|nr:hypothetical protein F4818DRAFT_443752 [Hypoxylon cercidicola]
MRYSTLAFAFLHLGALVCSAHPGTPFSPRAPEKKDTQATIQVDCPDKLAHDSYEQCYDVNSERQCPDKSGPDRTICYQLWQITCGKPSSLITCLCVFTGFVLFLCISTFA